MVDDNVHPSNTFAIAQVWQQSSTPFEMMLFANSDHGIRSPAYEAAKWSFILRNFGMWSQPPLGATPEATNEPAERDGPDAGAGSGAATAPNRP
jgi:hypothetical protein